MSDDEFDSIDESELMESLHDSSSKRDPIYFIAAVGSDGRPPGVEKAIDGAIFSDHKEASDYISAALVKRPQWKIWKAVVSYRGVHQWMNKQLESTRVTEAMSNRLVIGWMFG